jgi:hypothetical protein
MNNNLRNLILKNKKKLLERKGKFNFSLKNFLFEGGAGGHMMHPYDDDNLTFVDIRNIIEDAGSGMLDPQGKSRAVEKIDGYNMHFSVIPTGRPVDPEKDVIFIRSEKDIGKTENNLNWIRTQFGASPARDIFILGCEAIAEGCANISPSVISNTFGNPDMENQPQGLEYIATYVNTEIIFPARPIQIEYDKPTISFHEIKDYFSNMNDPTVKRPDIQFVNYTDQRYNQFINAFNSQNKNLTIKKSTAALNKGMNPEYYKDVEYDFEMIGSTNNLLYLNRLNDNDKNDLLFKLSQIQEESGLPDTGTLGELKFTYVKDVIEEQKNIIIEELKNIAPSVDDATLLEITNFIVQTISMQDLGLNVSPEYKELTGMSLKKKILDKAVQGTLADLGIFVKDKKKNPFVAKVTSAIGNALTEKFQNVTELFYVLGVKILEGLKSNLMSNENAKKQSEKLTYDLINCLIDFYNLPETDPLKQKLQKNIYKVELLISEQNKQLGINVDLNNKEDILDKAKNVSVGAVEGIVYNYGEKRFKFTGNYAPLNQIMGFNAARAFPVKFPRYYASKIQWNIDPSTNCVAIIPGSFKPPHMGHRKMIEHYIAKGAQQILVVVSDPQSEESLRRIGKSSLSASGVCILWKKLCADITNAKIDFIVSPASSPLDIAVSLVSKGSNKLNAGTTVYLGCSQKVDEVKEGVVVSTDADRFLSYLKTAIIDPDLIVPDPKENASPATQLPPQYLQALQSAGIYDQMPSVQSGKNPQEYHASDLRFLLNEVVSNPQIKKILVYFLKDVSVVNSYINFLYGSEIENQLLTVESILRKYVKSILY